MSARCKYHGCNYKINNMCFNVGRLYEQLQKKLYQLEEQLDHEMQAKDELEQKCK